MADRFGHSVSSASARQGLIRISAVRKGPDVATRTNNSRRVSTGVGHRTRRGRKHHWRARRGSRLRHGRRRPIPDRVVPERPVPLPAGRGAHRGPGPHRRGPGRTSRLGFDDGRSPHRHLRAVRAQLPSLAARDLHRRERLDPHRRVLRGPMVALVDFDRAPRLRPGLGAAAGDRRAQRAVDPAGRLVRATPTRAAGRDGRARSSSVHSPGRSAPQRSTRLPDR